MDLTKIAKKQEFPISGGGYSNIRIAKRTDLEFDIRVDSDNKAKVSDDIVFKDGATGFFPVYGTADRNGVTENSSETRDHDGHERSFRFFVPGSAEHFRQFMNENGSDEFIVLADEDATASTFLFGGGNGLYASLQAAFESNEAFMDAKGFVVTVSAHGYGFFPQYTGKGSIQQFVLMRPEESIIDASRGNVFVTAANETVAVSISDIENYKIGQTITIKGGGGTAPTKLQTTNAKFDLKEDWTGEKGAEIRIYIRAENEYIELDRKPATP